MPSKKTSPATPATKTLTKVAPPENATPQRFADIVGKVRAQKRAELTSAFEYFVEDALPEEIYFMAAVLNDWENRGSYSPAPPMDHEVNIYSAIQRQLSGELLLKVPQDEMLREIEQFIETLVKRSWKRKDRAAFHGQTPEQRVARFRDRVQTETELFARTAGENSLRTMMSVVAQWNELRLDAQLNGVDLPNVLAAAIEMVLQKLTVDAAVESAEKAVA